MDISDLDADNPANDTSGLFDAKLRDEIVNQLEVESKLNETDIRDQLRQQRFTLAGRIGAGSVAAILVVVAGYFSIRSVQAYIDANTFIVRAEHYAIEVNDRYIFAVSQDGNYLLDAFLVVEEAIPRGEETIYRVEQIAPEAMETYYWSIRKDGFYQFLNPDDAYPQVYIPFPLKAGKKWTAKVYPEERYSFAKQPVEAEFVASDEVILDLPIGETECIEITIREKGSDEVRTLWIAEASPIAKIDVDSSIVAELKTVDTVAQQ